MINSKAYIGIDNGLDGGIVALDGEGAVTFKSKMPVNKTGKGREIDVQGFAAIVEQLSPHAVFIVEQASKHSPGKMALCSTWHSFACMTTTLKLLKVQWDLVQPQKWQKAFWARPKMPKGQKFDTKAAALVAAKRIWPCEEWLASDRCKIAHNGMVDAALIAEHARRAGI
tara:strand:- start:2676 stop:3185 length:510 start_codon:yes stop_codon:yes gene_type:complete